MTFDKHGRVIRVGDLLLDPDVHLPRPWIGRVESIEAGGWLIVARVGESGGWTDRYRTRAMWLENFAA